MANFDNYTVSSKVFFRTTMLFHVLYKPELSIVQEPSELKEGEDVKITCNSKSNPEKVMFKWYIDDVIEYEKVVDEDLNDQSSTLQIKG